MPSSASTVSSVKFQIVKLICTLVQVCHTLDAVPEDRFLFMKLAYRDEVTPVDYEPPCFRAAAASSSCDDGNDSGVDADGNPLPGERAAYFPRKPFSIEAGKVQTVDHAVVICVKSTLDGAAPAPAPPAAAAAAAAAKKKKKNGGEGGIDEENTAAAAAAAVLFGGGSQPVPEAESGEDDDVSMTLMSDDDDRDGDEDEEGNDSGKPKEAAAALPSGETLERVRAWVAAKVNAVTSAAAAAPAAAAAAPKKGGRRGVGKLSAMMMPPPPPVVTATFTDALLHFDDASSRDLQASFDVLEREGVLVRAAADAGQKGNGGGEEEFVVVAATAATAAEKAPSAAAAAAAEVEATGRRLAALSCHGGVASAAGTEKTASLAKANKDENGKPASAPSVAPPGVHFEDSQPSPSLAVNATASKAARAAAPSRKRKLPIVKAPIQTVKGVSRVAVEVEEAVAAEEGSAEAAAAAAGGGAKEATTEEEEEAAPGKRAARGRGATAAAAAAKPGGGGGAGVTKTTARRRK